MGEAAVLWWKQWLPWQYIFMIVTSNLQCPADLGHLDVKGITVWMCEDIIKLLSDFQSFND